MNNKKVSPVLTSILDSSPRRTPPPIHTPGGETLQCLASSAPERKSEREREKKSPSLHHPPISKHWIITFAFSRCLKKKIKRARWFCSSRPTPSGLWVASTCAFLNAVHVFPARIISFTLPCTRRTNPKSAQCFTWSVCYHKHPTKSKFTAVAHSQFTPDWQISLLRGAFTVAGRAATVVVG